MSNSTISSRSTKALFWSLGGAAGKIVGQLLVQITLARVLGPEAFGQFAVLISVLSLGGTLADCGFGAALIQKKEISPADVSLALGWSLAISFSIAVVVSLIAPFLAHQFGDESLYWMFTVSAFLIVPQALGNLSTNLMQRDLNMKNIQIIHVFSYVVCFGVVATTLAILGWGGWSLVVGYAAQTFFKLIASYSICRHTLRLKFKGDVALIHFGLKSLANDLFNWSMDYFDRFIIGRFWGLSSLGLYSVAFNLSKAPSGLLVFAVQNIAFSSASRLQGDLVALRKGFHVVIAAMSLASIPLFGMVAYESEAVLHIVYGIKWLMAAPYMTALSIAIPLISLGSITAAMLRGTGSVGTELRVQMITAVVFFGGFILMKDFPLVIAVWIVPVTYLVRLTLLLIAICNNLTIRLGDILLSFRGAITLTVIGVSVTAGFHELSSVNSIAMGVLPLLAGCFVCVLFLLFKFNWFTGPQLGALIRVRFSAGSIGFIVCRLQRGKF